MTLPENTSGYVLPPGAGEAHDNWLGGARLVIKASAQQTQGRLAAVELWGPKGFGSPVHVHSNDDEFFVVLDGEVRFRLGDEVTDAAPQSIIYGPREVPHAFTVNSDEARMLLFFGPAGVEGFFREAAAYAATVPAGQQPDPQALAEIGARYGQKFVGPPMPPRA